MAVKKLETESRAEYWMGMGRKFYLAYLGAFGMAADEAGKLFEMFVKRGERVEKSIRRVVTTAQEEEPKVRASVEKSVKRAAKKIEAAA